MKFLVLTLILVSGLASALPMVPGSQTFDVLDTQTTASLWRGGPGDPPESEIFGQIRLTKSGNVYKTPEVTVSQDRYEVGFYFPPNLAKEFEELPYETRYGGYRLNVMPVDGQKKILVLVTSEMLGTFILPEYSGSYSSPRVLTEGGKSPTPTPVAAPVKPVAKPAPPSAPAPVPKSRFEDL